DQHEQDTFLFAPQPVQENELANNTGQDLDPADDPGVNFFTLNDPAVGNGAHGGGSIDFTTPYARVQGSGDGSYDIYTFDVTPDMFGSGEVNLGATVDSSSTQKDSNAPYFTKIVLQFNGKVTADDIWNLGIGYRDFSYKVLSGDGLRQVADGLANKIQTANTANQIQGYTVTVTGSGAAGSPVQLTITNPNGFVLQGRDSTSADGLQQDVAVAGTVTRITTASSTPFSSATH